MRVRGDMIETFKILSGKYMYDTNVVPHLKTTGIQAIFKTRFKYDLRKFYFTNRVVDARNGLPNWIVMANGTNTFTQVRHILARPGDYLRFSCTVTGNRKS